MFQNFSICSQNAEDGWNGFNVVEKPVEEKSTEYTRPPKTAAKVKTVEDFSNLDVKSKVSTAPKPKDDKEADLWDLLNS